MRMQRGWTMGIGALVLLLMSGCNIWLLFLPDVPFDATGTYSGTWEGVVTGSEDSVNACALTLQLRQDVGASNLERLKVEGEITLNFTCASLMTQLGEIGLPETLKLGMTGVMTPAGQLLLGSLEGSEDLSVVVGIDAQGDDADGDEYMDALTGDFVLYIEVPEYPRIDISGTLAVMTEGDGGE